MCNENIFCGGITCIVYFLTSESDGCLVWIQSSNPVTEMNITDFQMISGHDLLPTKPGYAFVGLQASLPNKALLDGCTREEPTDCYWYSVGNTGFWRNGMPGVHPGTVNTVELFTKIN